MARLILRRPKWIFLDETTSHLEEQEAIRLLRLVREKLPTSGVIHEYAQPISPDQPDAVLRSTIYRLRAGEVLYK
ncbi:hypothetical protein ACVBB4_001624 [Escherichia coli]